MIYGYIRVSTDKQTTENQKFEIEQFVSNQKITVNKWIMETISAGQDLEKRKLGKLLRKIKKDDIIITSELSRLGRNLLQIMSILHHCMNVEAQVWTIKDNYRLGRDIQSKVLAFAFGLSAEIEKQLISQRTKEALLRLRSEGRCLGRPKGSKNRELKLSGQESRIRQLLENGTSQRRAARILGVDRATLCRFLSIKAL